MRALAPRSQQAGGREWQWRMPRGNLRQAVTCDSALSPQRFGENFVDKIFSLLRHTKVPEKVL